MSKPLRKRSKRLRRTRYSPRDRSDRRPPELEFQTPRHPQAEDLGNPRVREIVRIIGGDQKEAEQIATLEANNPTHTMPELVAMNFLNGANAAYTAQPAVFGGRRQEGGLVPDFLVMAGGGWNAWLVQGTFYHSSGFQERHLQQGRDAAAKLRLEGAEYAGRRIQRVITLNEDRIYEDRPFIFELAMLGQEMPY